jgi:hypothetical protein
VTDFDSLPEDPAPAPTGLKFDDLPDDHTSLGEQAKTVAEGLARGVTLGASDVFETMPTPEVGTFKHALMSAIPGAMEAKWAIGQVDPKNIAGRMEANPGESIGSQMVGGGLSIAGTGGAGSLIKGGAEMGQTAGLAKGIATNLALKGTALGAEGAAFGAGNAVTDYALGDPNVNAQKVLGDMGEGAMFNLAGGAILHGVETVAPISQSINKIFGVLKDKTNGVIDGISGNYFQKLRAGMSGIVPDDVVRSLAKNVDNLHGVHEDALDKIYGDWSNRDVNPIKDVPIAQVQDPVLTASGNIEKLVSSMEAEPNRYKYTPKQLNEARAVADTLGESALNATDSVDLHNDLWEARKRIGKIVNWGAKGSEELKNVYDTIGETMKNPDLWGKEATDQFSAMDNTYRTGRLANQDFQRLLMTQELGKPVSSFGKLRGLLNSIENPDAEKVRAFDNFLTASQETAKLADNFAGNAGIKNVMQDRLAQVAKEYADSQKLASLIKKQPSMLPSVLKSLTYATIGAAHPAASVVLGAIEAARTLSQPYELGKTINNTYKIMGALGKITNRATRAISSGAKAIVQSNPIRGALESGGISGRTYDERVKRIQELQSNPQAMLDHLEKSTSAMYEAAPNISRGIHNAIIAGANFLASKIPQPASKFPLSGDWEPSEAQKDQFNQYYNTVDNPMSTLEEVRNGTISNHQIEALQAVYPHLLNEMRTNLVQQLDSKKAEDLPYGTKFAISKFLGMPLDGNMTQMAIASNQTAFIPSQQAQQPPQKGGKSPKNSTLGGLKELDVANRASTQTEVLEKEEV